MSGERGTGEAVVMQPPPDGRGSEKRETVPYGRSSDIATASLRSRLGKTAITPSRSRLRKAAIASLSLTLRNDATRCQGRLGKAAIESEKSRATIPRLSFPRPRFRVERTRHCALSDVPVGFLGDSSAPKAPFSRTPCAPIRSLRDRPRTRHATARLTAPCPDFSWSPLLFITSRMPSRPRCGASART